jgi:hypothetical protein
MIYSYRTRRADSEYIHSSSQKGHFKVMSRSKCSHVILIIYSHTAHRADLEYIYSSRSKRSSQGQNITIQKNKHHHQVRLGIYIYNTRGGRVGNFLIFQFLAYLISYCFDLEMIFLNLNHIYTLDTKIRLTRKIFITFDWINRF